MAYKSKYTGEGIEEILDNALLKKSQQLTDAEKETARKNLGIKEPDLSPYALKDEVPKNTSEINNDSGYTTTDEVELVIKKAVEAIPIPDVGEQISQALVDYVKKVEGKGLSTNDFTNELKKKLEGITPYDPSGLEAEISKLENTLNTLVAGNASNAIESFNEIIAFLENVSDTESLSGIIAGINTRIAEVEGKIPTKTSELNNDSGFLTEHQDISHLATKEELQEKQDIISDLEDIREGAALGATALQGDGVVMRIEKVSALPTNPDANTLYIIV